jgi:uncharacterized heparinase superfamily protein
VIRYLRALRRLRPAQAAAVLHRRLRGASPAHPAADAPRRRTHPPFRSPIVPRDSGAPGVLAFVGLEAPVAAGIDWRSDAMPRLWRYHLHYFDYLADPRRSDAWKRSAIDDWIERNPQGTPDAWEPYPASLRIVNWIRYFGTLDPQQIPAHALESLYAQALWLETNVEYHVLANHILKNAKALVFAGVFFEGRDAARWLRAGTALLESQTREQFLADGGHFERSPMYHAIATEDLLDVLAFGGSMLPEAAAATLRTAANRAVHFLEHILLPDGDIPLFNDAARDFAAPPGALLAYAHDVLGFVSAVPKSGVSTAALDASGYYVIRDGHDALVIDCGALGPLYQPGHAHCDLLSYELSLGGERVVVDAGVFDYGANRERAYTRSTAAHNTVTVDGREQAEMWGAFRVGRRPRPLAAELRASDDGVTFAGAHDGFAGGPSYAVHSRAVAYRNGAWSVLDRVEPATVRGERKNATAESRVHLRPGLCARRDGADIIIQRADGTRCAVLTPTPGSDVRLERAPHFPRFGVREEGDVVVLRVAGALPLSFGYAIVRAAASTERARSPSV